MLLYFCSDFRSGFQPQRLDVDTFTMRYHVTFSVLVDVCPHMRASSLAGHLGGLDQMSSKLASLAR